MKRRRMRAVNLKGSEAKRDDNEDTISIGKLIAKLEHGRIIKGLNERNIAETKPSWLSSPAADLNS